MQQIFINIPVKDVNASQVFYEALGFRLNPLFTFEHQKCMQWASNILLMLQSHGMYQAGNEKKLADPKEYGLATFTLPLESLAKVDELVAKALNAGGTERLPMIDEGFMQIRNIEDLDGHAWALIFLDIEAFKKATGKR